VFSIENCIDSETKPAEEIFIKFLKYLLGPRIVSDLASRMCTTKTGYIEAAVVIICTFFGNID
jgi:hypothetical protein